MGGSQDTTFRPLTASEVGSAAPLPQGRPLPPRSRYLNLPEAVLHALRQSLVPQHAVQAATMSNPEYDYLFKVTRGAMEAATTP